MLGETQSIAFANEIGIVIKHKGGVKRKPRKGHPSAEVGSARGGKEKAYGSRHTNNNQITCERAAANRVDAKSRKVEFPNLRHQITGAAGDLKCSHAHG